MFQLSKKTDYALIALQYLRASGSGRTVRAKEIAVKFHIPVEVLSQVMALLVRKGLLTSGGGPHGGYSLAKPLSNISVLSVVQAIEGGKVAVSAKANQRGGVRGSPQLRVQERIMVLLNDISVEQLHPENQTAVILPRKKSLTR